MQVDQLKRLEFITLLGSAAAAWRLARGLEKGHRNPTVVTVYELATALGAN